MPVNSLHPDYVEMLPAWSRARDVMAGEDAVKTAEAIQLRQTGEHSILGNIALSVSESMTQILRWAYWWNSTEESPDNVTTEQVTFELNTDFSIKGLAEQEIQSIVAAWQGRCHQPRHGDGFVPARRSAAGRTDAEGK